MIGCCDTLQLAPSPDIMGGRRLGRFPIFTALASPILSLLVRVCLSYFHFFMHELMPSGMAKSIRSCHKKKYLVTTVPKIRYERFDIMSARARV